MNTPLDTRAAPDLPPDDAKPVRMDTRRRPWAIVVGAAAAAALVVGGIGATAGWFDGDAEVAEPTVLDLSAGEVATTMGSCIVVEPQYVADQQVAFRGTVESVDGDQVTLRVDRWYKGGDTDLVTVTAPSGQINLAGEIEWIVGEPYLVSAWEGTVTYCEFSGPATPERQALYDAAFPS